MGTVRTVHDHNGVHIGTVTTAGDVSTDGASGSAGFATLHDAFSPCFSALIEMEDDR